MKIVNPVIFSNEEFVLITNKIAEDIEEFRYYVSNYGNIYDSKKGIYVPSYPGSGGYIYVFLDTKSKKFKSYLLHRLVCTAFDSIRRHKAYTNISKDYNFNLNKVQRLSKSIYR